MDSNPIWGSDFSEFPVGSFVTPCTSTVCFLLCVETNVSRAFVAKSVTYFNMTSMKYYFQLPPVIILACLETELRKFDALNLLT